MNVMTVNEDNVEIFSKVLIEAAQWLDSLGQLMWKVSDLSAQKLLEKYSMEEMRLCCSGTQRERSGQGLWFLCETILSFV